MSYIRTGIATVVAWVLGVFAGREVGQLDLFWPVVWLFFVVLNPLIVGVIAARWHFVPCILVNFILHKTMQDVIMQRDTRFDWESSVTGWLSVLGFAISACWSLVFLWIMKLKRDDSAPVCASEATRR